LFLYLYRKAVHSIPSYGVSFTPYYGSPIKYPSPVIDNWAAAMKVREYYEEQVEKRKAAGKPIY
jgi:hypothetical protein